MTPIFLSHTALDAVGILEDALPTVAMGRDRLRALLDRAMAEGAHVLLLAWPALEWVLLAVEVPPGVVIEDAQQLIPYLLANPGALDHMRFFVPRIPLYGGCAWETFGSAAVLYARFANPRTAATLKSFGDDHWQLLTYRSFTDDQPQSVQNPWRCPPGNGSHRTAR